MSRFLPASFMVSILAAHLFAQSPTPAPPSSAAPSATGIPSKSPAISSPSPAATPSAQELVDSLGPPDLQAVITLLKSNFTNTDAITETELNRATLEGLMVRLPRGVMLFTNKESARVEAPSAFYDKVLGVDIGYLRPGSLNSANLQALDRSLSNFAGNEAHGNISDF